MEHIIGLADLWLTLAGVALLLLGLRGRSGRGKRWCCKCWYDMTGVPGLTCPECGRTARDERGLQRRRRSRGVMAAGMAVLALAYGAGVGPRVYARGWDGGKSVVPTLVLIAGLPWWPSYGTLSLGNELRQRICDNELRLGEWWLLTERCVRGDSEARPGSVRWMQRYQSMLELMPSFGAPPLSERNHQRILDRAAPRIVMTRKHWPAGVPVLLDEPIWFPLQSHWQGAKLEISVVGGPNVQCEFVVTEPPIRCGELRFAARDGLASLGVLEPGRVHELELRLIHRERVVWQGRTPAPFTIGGGVEETLRPMALANELNADLLGALQLESNQSDTFLVLGPDAVKALDGATFAVVAELCYLDAVVATERVWWSRNRKFGSVSTAKLWWRWTPADRTLIEAHWQEPGWTVRLRADAEHALRDFQATRYWPGTIVFERAEQAILDPDVLHMPRRFQLQAPH